MGSSQSAPTAAAASSSSSGAPLPPPPQQQQPQQQTSTAMTMQLDGPPKLTKTESLEEKMWRKFSSQPLVPIGCVATAYFLASGIKSFRDRNPVQSQRMMRNRVAAQFATIMVFIGYMGGENNFDWRLAPMYQDAKRVEHLLLQQQEATTTSTTTTTTASGGGSGTKQQPPPQQQQQPSSK